MSVEADEFDGEPMVGFAPVAAGAATEAALLGRKDLTRQCANCGTRFQGEFCPACGQKDDVYNRRIWKLIGESLTDLLDWDGRFFSTLRALILRPGQVSRDYVEGRRARWSPPIRLYLIASLVFFFVNDLDTTFDPQHVDTGAAIEGAARQASREFGQLAGWTSEEGESLTEVLAAAAQDHPEMAEDFTAMRALVRQAEVSGNPPTPENIRIVEDAVQGFADGFAAGLAESFAESADKGEPSPPLAPLPPEARAILTEQGVPEEVIGQLDALIERGRRARAEARADLAEAGAEVRAELERNGVDPDALREQIAASISDRAPRPGGDAGPDAGAPNNGDPPAASFEADVEVAPAEATTGPGWLKPLEDRFRRGAEQLREQEGAFARAAGPVFQQVPLIMAPIFALMTGFMYMRSGEMLFGHMVLAMHIHVGGMLIFSIATIAGWIVGESWTAAIGVLAVIIYVHQSLARFFDQGGAKTLFKLFWLALGYGFWLSMITLVLLVQVTWSLGGA
ncbi:MAG: DUF3667 domain-containing protein [Maricaulaceae bacterium]